MADTTLDAIRTKVRRLTRSPSEAQISTADIDEYINTFVLYDFPEQLRLSALRTTLTFYTAPYIDTYETSSTVGEPLYNFKNIYTSVHTPLYIAGVPATLSQSRDEFYGLYPLVNSLQDVETGDGATISFSGTLTSVPIVSSNVTFSAIDINNERAVLYDDGAGILSGDGFGTINYVTGAWTATFTTAPQNGTAIQAQTIPYVASVPRAILYYDSKFVVRPIPDRPYRIDIEAYKRPTELLAAGQSPDLEQWWQYIAYGASKKVFEDRSDLDSVQSLMPEFKEQEALVNRKTIMQQTDERVATIYSDGFYKHNSWFWQNNS